MFDSEVSPVDDLLAIMREYRDASMFDVGAVFGLEIRESTIVDRGEAILINGHVFMHGFDIVRLRHPKGLYGSLAAAEEWAVLCASRKFDRLEDRLSRRVVRANLSQFIKWHGDSFALELSNAEGPVAA